MQEPCRSCERRTVDFGGCRCQALLIAGDAAATDPACSLSPQHELVELATQNSAEADAHPDPDPLKLWVYRPDPSHR
jgi:pyrroloquinoline quinone biosynthesis protein E